MMRLYMGCGTRRLTSTTMVFCILVETTSPTFSFFNAVPASFNAVAASVLASVSAIYFFSPANSRSRRMV